jgi:nitrogen regulatory protein P-II 1
MKFVTAYVRSQRSGSVARALHEAGVRGLTAYVVQGMSGETTTFLRGLDPFEPSSLPDSVKVELICDETLVDEIVTVIAQASKTGYPGDGIIAVQDVEKMARIQDLSAPAKERGTENER